MSDTTVSHAIGGRVRQIRQNKKIRQADLAAHAGLSVRHLIRIEQGNGGEAKPETLDGLAKALGVERSALTGDDDEEAAPVSIEDLIEYMLVKAAAYKRERVR